MFPLRPSHTVLKFPRSPYLDNHLSESFHTCTLDTLLVFPPAPKKGMVKSPGKGHFKRAKRAKRALLERAATG